jgi:TonB family protein
LKVAHALCIALCLAGLCPGHFWVLAQDVPPSDSVALISPDKSSLPPPPPGVLRISNRVMAGLLENKVYPVYPPDAIALNACGLVVLLATIDKTGEVTDVEVVFGPERFRDAAVDAVRQWRYRPYVIDGEATEVQTRITLNFVPPGALPPDTVRVPSGVLAGMLVSKVKPVYPLDAKVSHVWGAVVLSARVGTTGSVEDLHVISGPEMLRASALDAVKRWQFRPLVLDGQLVGVKSTITVNFSVR